jgi:hypothetical protein
MSFFVGEGMSKTYSMPNMALNERFLHNLPEVFKNTNIASIR